MSVDFSKFEHPHEWDNWFGTVCVQDGASVKNVRVEIQTEEDFIPEAAKETLSLFAEHYAEYMDALAEPVLEYYETRRAAWGHPPADDPLYPEIHDSRRLAEMYSLKSVVIHDPDESEKDTIGLLFDCTWDDEGMGVRMVGMNVEEIGIQGTQY